MLAGLARFVDRLNAELEPPALLQIICDEAAVILELPAAAAGIYAEHANWFRYTACAPNVAACPRLLAAAPLEPAPHGWQAAAPTTSTEAALFDELGGEWLGTFGLWHNQRPLGVLLLLLPRGASELPLSRRDLLTVLAGLAAQALGSALQRTAALSRLIELEAINTLSRALAETLELERIFALLYEAALALLPEVAGAIFSLFDAERQEMHCVFALLDGEQIDAHDFPPLLLAPPGQGFQSDAIHTRRPVLVGSQEEMLQRQARMHYIGSAGDAAESILFVPMLARGRVVGVLQVQSFTLGAFSMAHATRLGLAANVAAVAIENARLVADLQRSNLDLRQAYDETLAGWSRALDLRDRETQGHSERVTELTLRLARAAGMSEQDLVAVRWGALLHDIGKVGIPDAVLFKPGPLSDDEWQAMRMHPVYAYNLLQPIEFLHPALDIPYCHHERWDGSGYPQGLRGAEIPLAARIFAIVDIWDALRSDRPYRSAWPEAQVLEHLRGLAGSHLDPEVVALFFRVMADGE